MALGYNNKVLIVDLTTGKMSTEEPGEKFYRQYLGGSGLGTYYCMRDIPKNADPLGSENVLVLSVGVVTGAPVIAASRMVANAKSPVTGGIGDAQGGGYWGPAFKFAGFDAVVFKGKSEKPVYLFVENGKAELRDASHIWGMKTKDYESALRCEISKDVVVAGIGPAGENLCRFACIINERKHAAGRTGMGAVMGSKNLKCVAAIGKKPQYGYADTAKLQEHARYANEWAKTSPRFNRMFNYGTNGGIANNNNAGMLPTKNFAEGWFEPTDDKLTSMVMNDTISIGNERCYMCNIACKRHVACNKEEHGWDVDPAYGGPEYETVSAFGSYLMIDDLPTVSKANEICNANSLDTISAGATIAFAMECYENGILTDEMTDGLKLNFGNRQAAIALLERIVNRQGYLGNLLAEGPTRAAKVLGKGAERFDMSVKGNPHPAHMPQVKKNLALHYAVNPYGSDHMSVMHDVMFNKASLEGPTATEFFQLDIYEPHEPGTLDADRVKTTYYSQLYRTILDSLVVCMMGYGIGDSLYNIKRTVEIVNACTGWDTNLWELMKAAERTRNLMRLFNQREGLDKKDDMLPELNFDRPFTVGPSKGEHVDREEFMTMRDLYYDMVGWDVQTGNPKLSKLVELGLTWARV